MKTVAIALLMIGMVLGQTTKEVVLSDSGEKTAEEVQEELQCVKHSKWNDFFETHFTDLGLEYIRAQLSKGASNNKKYYIKINQTHNVMYFKEGKNFFVYLNQIAEDGSEVLLMRSFLQDDFLNCIQLLPESCKWKGDREVKYIEVCEKGIVLAKGFTQDFFKVAIDESEGQFDPIDIAKAIRNCYQPNVYSVGYKCYIDGLYFDPAQAVAYLNEVRAKLEEYNFNTQLDLENLTIKYVKTAVTVNGVRVELENPLDTPQ